MSRQLREKILLILEEHARTDSSYYKEDKEIAEQLGHSVGEIQRQLNILESQGLITAANSHDGNSALISPKGSLEVERFEESLGESKRLDDLGTVISVFISHSHHDIGLVKCLITLLRSALNLPSRQIRATSVDGFRLPGGANTAEQLRAEVKSSKVLIGLISEASLRSAYVIFELGARWGSERPMVPLLAPDVDPGSLAGPLQGINALSCGAPAQLHQLVEEIGGHLSMPLDRPAAYQKCVDEIVALCSNPGRPELVNQHSAAVGAAIEQPLAPLSEAAKELLLEASHDEQGAIVRTRTATGLHIRTNGRDFVTDRHPRVEAHWQGALKELIVGGFLEDRKGKGEVFSLTDLAFQKADSLTKGAPNPANTDG